MVGGHWVGCIIGRQFRQLALPQARKQKTLPSLTSQESFLSVFPYLEDIEKKQTPPLFLGSLLSIIAIIAIIEVHLLQNYLQIYQKPKNAAVIKVRTSCSLPYLKRVRISACRGGPTDQGGVRELIVLPLWFSILP